MDKYSVTPRSLLIQFTKKDKNCSRTVTHLLKSRSDLPRKTHQPGLFFTHEKSASS